MFRKHVVTAKGAVGAAALVGGLALSGSLAVLPARAQVRAVAAPAPAASAAPVVVPAPVVPAPAAVWNERAATRVTGVRKRVLALYYPWYATPAHGGKWVHQDGLDAAHKRLASHVHFPASGPYDSADPAVIDRHLRQAKAAGIDTLVCSWWGKNDPTDAAIRTLCQRAPLQGMEVCILWERLSRRADPAAAAEDLSYLQDTFTHQQTYLKEGGKPVIFLYATVCSSLAPDQWAPILSEANHRSKTGVLLVGDVGPAPSLADMLLWDGLYHLGHALHEAGHTPAESARLLQDAQRAPIFFARQAGRISVEALAPGYDDRQLVQALRPPSGTARSAAAGARPAPPTRPGTVVDRQGGGLWTALWEQAIRDRPDWILINSFNQWHVGTEIEPSVELGDRYLTGTAPLAARFRETAERRTASDRR